MRLATLGAWAENQVRKHLEGRGWAFRDANWRAREGEIDLVMADGDQIIFVEVKCRVSDRFGAPEEGLTPAKLRRIHKAAWAYLEAQGLEQADWRVDLVAIECTRGRRILRLDHYENVLGEEGRV